eukprot:UN20485
MINWSKTEKCNTDIFCPIPTISPSIAPTDSKPSCGPSDFPTASPTNCMQAYFGGFQYCTTAEPCLLGQGHCNYDWDCVSGLKCYRRNTADEFCGNGIGNCKIYTTYAYNFCGDPLVQYSCDTGQLYPTYAPNTPSPSQSPITPKPSNTPTT